MMPEDCLASRSMPRKPRRRHKRRGKTCLLATKPAQSGPPVQGTDRAPIQHLLKNNQSRGHHWERHDCRVHANLLTRATHPHPCSPRGRVLIHKRTRLPQRVTPYGVAAQPRDPQEPASSTPHFTAVRRESVQSSYFLRGLTSRLRAHRNPVP